MTRKKHASPPQPPADPSPDIPPTDEPAPGPAGSTERPTFSPGTPGSRRAAKSAPKSGGTGPKQ